MEKPIKPSKPKKPSKWNTPPSKVLEQKYVLCINNDNSQSFCLIDYNLFNYELDVIQKHSLSFSLLNMVYTYLQKDFNIYPLYNEDNYFLFYIIAVWADNKNYESEVSEFNSRFEKYEKLLSEYNAALKEYEINNKKYKLHKLKELQKKIENE
jgi:hypothetical protein